jgi:hydrogenase nickel incorporation protein HypB
VEKIRLERKVLNENDVLAAELRGRFAGAGILCINLVSSPGSGKTSLLERILERLKGDIPISVVEGDVHTDNDARRLAGYGVPVHQIETGGACHLDAKMINRALESLDIGSTRLLFIENVGNLVCPSSFDLGEDMKVAIVSTTEGDDKPQKYPAMFARSKAMIINKTDLLPYVDFDADAAIAHAKAVSPGIETFLLSCKTGEGIDAWCDWLRKKVTEKGA